MRKFVPLMLQANRVRRGEFASDDSAGMRGMFRLLTPGGGLVLAVSSGPDHQDWEHVAVSSETRTPTHDEMVFVKDLFWSEDELVVQYHLPGDVPRPNALHLWKSTRMPIPVPPRKPKEKTET